LAHQSEMVSQDVLLRIVGHIYEAGGDATLWTGVLTSISDALNGAGASLLIHNLQSTTGAIAASVRVDPQALREYGEHYVKLDPWLQRAYRVGKLRPGLAVTGVELVPNDEFARTPYCAEFAARYGITRFLGGAILVEGPVSSSLSLLRNERDFSEEELAFVRELMPHLARALQFHRRLSHVQEASQAATDALERLPLGVILLDATGRVLFANVAARTIAELNDGLSLHGDGPSASLRAETTALRRIIADALAIPGRARRGGGALSLSRPSRKRSLEVLVTVLGPTAAARLGDSGARAAMFVSDPTATISTDAQVLQQLYGLTPTEARVAAGLAGGLSIRDIADANTMTMNTARWHAKNVFAKTDTAGQGDLIRLLLTGPASVLPFR
jgi:DNA-binding CsgD family transcriptional regulator/GAF domain-containing protein